MKNEEKLKENRLRRKAYKQGVRIEKSRIRNANIDNHGGYRLIDVYTNTLVDGHRYELTLAEIEHNLDESSNMNTRKQKLKHLFYKYLWESHKNEMNGELSSLMLIYEEYDNPVALSPLDAFSKPFVKEVVEKMHDDGNLIKYSEDDILGNPNIVNLYLQLIDSETYSEHELNSYMHGLDSVIAELWHIHPDFFDGQIGWR
jgi:hypothetical protein